MKRGFGKRGQVAVFVIAGIVLVGVVVTLIVLVPESPRSGPPPGSEVQSNALLQQCLKDDVLEAIKYVSLRGGYVSNPLSVEYALSKDEKANVSYLCYRSLDDSIPCASQEAFLFRRLQEEVKKYLKDSRGEDLVKKCHDELVDNYGRSGYRVTERYEDFNVSLRPGKAEIFVDAEISATRGDGTIREDSFMVPVRTRLYEMADHVRRIVDGSQASCGYDPLVKYARISSPFVLNSKLTSDFSHVFNLTDEVSGEAFIFAVRGCVLR